MAIIAQAGRRRCVGPLVLMLGMGLVAGASAQYQGWLIPDGGRDEKSPLAPTPALLATGGSLFLTHCASCHRPDGTGAGPGSDHAADLTDPYRADLNTEGVLFYKVWNGHAIQLRTQVDDMPAFQGKLTRNEVWTLVEHLKVLRAAGVGAVDAGDAAAAPTGSPQR